MTNRPAVLKAFLLGFFLFVHLPTAFAQAVQAMDATGVLITLPAPAKRIISLAPHITELIFAAGAGDKLVGVVDYSDYPSAAAVIERIGDATRLDYERIVELKPDLVIAWASGNTTSMIEKLRSLSFSVFLSEPRTFDDIADSVTAVGNLAGTPSIAENVAAEFLDGVDQLRQRHAHASEISVFHPIWTEPLMTLGGAHIFNEVLSICGARNIFATLNQLAATVDIESVIKADPDLILIGHDNVDSEALDQAKERWASWPAMRAVQAGQISIVQSDIVHRSTIRLLSGTKQVCKIIDAIRQRM